MINKKYLSISVIDYAPDMKYQVEHTSDGDIIVHEKPESEWKDSSVMLGGITINGRFSKFYMSLNIWSATDYIQQWDEGIRRLEKFDESCLVADVVNDRLTAVEWWLLYRIHGKIHAQYHVYCESPYKNAIKKGLFTPKTCYDFIPPRQTHEDDGEEISEKIIGAYWDDTDEFLAKNKGIHIRTVYRDEEMAICQLFIGNDFYETFEIEDCCWSIEEYMLQWKQGLERLYSHDSSCLVLSVSSPDCGRFINWWKLYKKDEMIYVYNQIILLDIYEEMIGTKEFTIENCYDFIPEQNMNNDESEGEVSEWCVKYSDLFK